jgi:hypothetical protein
MRRILVSGVIVDKEAPHGSLAFRPASLHPLVKPATTVRSCAGLLLLGHRKELPCCESVTSSGHLSYFWR